MRSLATKVLWVGRATVFLVGLAVELALIFGAAATALGADGGSFILGEQNVASRMSTLIRHGTGPGLSIQTDDGPPLKTNSRYKVSNLNADKVDGLSSVQLRGAYARVQPTDPPTFVAKQSSGFASVTRLSTGLYCLEPASGVQVRGRAVAVSVDWTTTTAPEANASVMVLGTCGTNGIQIATERQFVSNGSLNSSEANDIGFHVVSCRRRPRGRKHRDPRARGRAS